MRIAISGYFLLYPATGTGQYSANLIRELARLCPDELLVICPRETTGLVRSLLTVEQGYTKVVPLSLPVGGDLGKLWFEQIGLPWACYSRQVDLLHVLYLGPPLAKPCRTALTIHDLIMLLFPETRRSLRARAYTRLARVAARRADLVLADSASTKKDVVRVLRIPQERIRVVPLGYDETFRPVADAGSLEGVRKKYGLEKEFVFYIGGLDWRKNLPRLLRAFSTINTTRKLAIAGRALSNNRTAFPNLAGLARDLGIQDRVVFLGQVPEEDKAPLYSACTVFVFPSLYEGFGLTPLEAMACGAPVVCSRASSLPEVVGEAAVLFDPTDVEEMARALTKTLTDRPLRERMRRAGLVQAGKFSWRRTAEETLEAYRQVTGGVAGLRAGHVLGAAGLSVEAGSRSTTCVVCPTGPSRIWGDQRLSRWNTALRRARREASNLRGRVLEVGCGAGRFTRALKEGSPGAVFFGCDLDPVSLSVGKSYCDGARYAAADLHVLPFLDGSFRAVLLFDVLEHLQEPALALSELYRVLEPEGILHALVPCEGQPGSLHWLLRRLRLGGDLKERHSGHIQRFTRREVWRLLGETGFRVERVTYSIHPMGQVRDILSYVEQEAWFERWHLGNPLFRLVMRLLWAASYLESNLVFKHIPVGAVALHVTARRKREP